MADAKVGKTSRRFGGRKKGTPNKLTADLKNMILGALDQAGGQQYLVDRAHDQPKAFLALVGRVLPMQVSGTGENGEHVVSVSIKFK